MSSFEDRNLAAERYDALEAQIDGVKTRDAVLVAVESLAALRSASPNYFLDISAFRRAVEDAMT